MMPFKVNATAYAVAFTLNDPKGLGRGTYQSKTAYELACNGSL